MKHWMMNITHCFRIIFCLAVGMGLPLLWIAGVSPEPAIAHTSEQAINGNKGLYISSGHRPLPTPIPSPFTVLVDDFVPQPYQGESVYFYNRLGGDRGVMGDGEVQAVWGQGQVTITVISANWAGVWSSLNHPVLEEQPINFQAILPSPILPEVQSQITGLSLQVAGGTAGSTFKIELKNEQSGTVVWWDEVTLAGGPQTFRYDLPPLSDVTNLNWLMVDTAPGDFVVVDNVAFTATTPLTDTAMAAFVWSYGMLLNNWNPETGLVRDKAQDPSGVFDAIQATGGLAAATAMAEQLGVITRADAITIVTTISNTLLNEIPTLHGLWPHWVKQTPTGTFTIVQDTEWSSVDLAIGALSLLEGQIALGLDTSGTENRLEMVDWNALWTPAGLSHGYTYSGELIPYVWDTFGGESWLLGLVYAAATGNVAPIEYCTPPTANGSGFIDELAWLFVPPPPTDCWGTDWQTYRYTAADVQLSYYPSNYPTHCYVTQGWFGLSAAEVPAPSEVAPSTIYQAFGVGGRFLPAHDGSLLPGLETPVIIPHYSALIASLRPTETLSMWYGWLNDGLFSPLNNLESLIAASVSDCDPASIQWNSLKGSWNLVLQTLGWGRYLAERQNWTPILWQSLSTNAFLSAGYDLVTSVPITAITIHGPQTIYSTSAHFSTTIEPANASLPMTITWNNSIVGEEADYTWNMPGVYTVSLTAVDRCGHVLTATLPVIVYPTSSYMLFLPVTTKE